MATRSGLSVATVARLEQSGQGQLSSLIYLCGALGRLDDFEALLKAPAPASLDELRRRRATEGGCAPTAGRVLEEVTAATAEVRAHLGDAGCLGPVSEAAATAVGQATARVRGGA